MYTGSYRLAQTRQGDLSDLCSYPLPCSISQCSGQPSKCTAALCAVITLTSSETRSRSCSVSYTLLCLWWLESWCCLFCLPLTGYVTLGKSLCFKFLIYEIKGLCFLAIDFPLLLGSNMVASKAVGLGSEVWRKLQCCVGTGLALDFVWSPGLPLTWCASELWHFSLIFSIFTCKMEINVLSCLPCRALRRACIAFGQVLSSAEITRFVWPVLLNRKMTSS